jgi:hypothetical protein
MVVPTFLFSTACDTEVKAIAGADRSKAGPAEIDA